MTLHKIAQPEKIMFSGYRRLFWGILLMVFHITLSWVRIFPEFIGCMVFVSGVGRFKSVADSPNLRRAYILASTIAAIELFEFAAPMLIRSFSIPRHWSILITSAASGLMMLLIYDIFCASSEMLRLNGNSLLADYLDKRLFVFVTIHTLLSIAMVLLIVVIESRLLAVTVLCVIPFRLWLAAVFAKLKRQYGDAVPEAIDVTEEITGE